MPDDSKLVNEDTIDHSLFAGRQGGALKGGAFWFPNARFHLELYMKPEVFPPY
jgi:hypothetical protein